MPIPRRVSTIVEIRNTVVLARGILQEQKRHQEGTQYPNNYGHTDEKRFSCDVYRVQCATDTHCSFAEYERIQCDLCRFSPFLLTVLEKSQCETQRLVISSHLRQRIATKGVSNLKNLPRYRRICLDHRRQIRRIEYQNSGPHIRRTCEARRLRLRPRTNSRRSSGGGCQDSELCNQCLSARSVVRLRAIRGDANGELEQYSITLVIG